MRQCRICKRTIAQKENFLAVLCPPFGLVCRKCRVKNALRETNGKALMQYLILWAGRQTGALQPEPPALTDFLDWVYSGPYVQAGNKNEEKIWLGE